MGILLLNIHLPVTGMSRLLFLNRILALAEQNVLNIQTISKTTHLIQTLDLSKNIVSYLRIGIVRRCPVFL
jgi:hypothetical protein